MTRPVALAVALPVDARQVASVRALTPTGGSGARGKAPSDAICGSSDTPVPRLVPTLDTTLDHEPLPCTHRIGQKIGIGRSVQSIAQQCSGTVPRGPNREFVPVDTVSGRQPRAAASA